MTRAQPLAPRRRGYLLFELVLLLAVVGVFALVAGKLMAITLNAMAQTQRREQTARRFDLAMDQLRADVWSARVIEADGRSATLQESDGQKIIWRAEPEPADDRSGAPSPFGPSISVLRRVERSDASSRKTNATTAPTASADVTQWEPLPAGISFAAEGPTLSTHVPATDDRLGNDVHSQITMISKLQFLMGGKP